MGNSNEPEASRQHRSIKKRYLRTIAKSQVKFIKNDIEEGNYGRRWSYGSSFISEDLSDQQLDWKIVFESYLEEKKDMYFWARELLENEFVAREKCWVDSMFYERFSLAFFGSKAAPKLGFDLNDWAKTKLEETMIRAGISDRPLGRMEANENQNEAELFVAKRDFINKCLAQSIDEAIKDVTNPFNILIYAFRKIFLKCFLENIREYQASFYEDYRDNFAKARVGKFFVPKALTQRCQKTKEAFLTLQRFIKLLMHCLTYMYAPVVGADVFPFLKEFLVNSLVDVIINKEVYTVIFMFLRMEHQAEEMVIEKKIKELRYAKPEDLSISPYLCLDEAAGSTEIFNAISKNAGDTNNWQEMLKERITKNTEPYKEAIQKLKEIAKLDTPIEKLKCIASLNSVICRCIDDFWKDIPVPRDKLFIDADQYLSILVYIVVKARVRDLFTHITLSNEFATLGSTSSYNAYCLTTLQASFYHLLNIDIDIVLRSSRNARSEMDNDPPSPYYSEEAIGGSERVGERLSSDWE